MKPDSSALRKLAEACEIGCGAKYTEAELAAGAEAFRIRDEAGSRLPKDLARRLEASLGEISFEQVNEAVFRRALLRLARAAISTELNIDYCVFAAACVLGPVTESADSMDARWLEGYFSLAETVSDLGLQAVWGKCLALYIKGEPTLGLSAMHKLIAQSPRSWAMFTLACSRSFGDPRFLMLLPEACGPRASPFLVDRVDGRIDCEDSSDGGDRRRRLRLRLRLLEQARREEARGFDRETEGNETETGQRGPTDSDAYDMLITARLVEERESTLTIEPGDLPALVTYSGIMARITLDETAGSKAICMPRWEFSSIGNDFSRLVEPAPDLTYLTLLGQRLATHGIWLTRIKEVRRGQDGS